MTTKLTPKQIEAVVNWMNDWEQLKGTSIPLRFKEDFSEAEIDLICPCDESDRMHLIEEDDECTRCGKKF